MCLVDCLNVYEEINVWFRSLVGKNECVKWHRIACYNKINENWMLNVYRLGIHWWMKHLNIDEYKIWRWRTSVYVDPCKCLIMSWKCKPGCKRKILKFAFEWRLISNANKYKRWLSRRLMIFSPFV